MKVRLVVALAMAHAQINAMQVAWLIALLLVLMDAALVVALHVVEVVLVVVNHHAREGVVLLVLEVAEQAVHLHALPPVKEHVVTDAVLDALLDVPLVQVGVICPAVEAAMGYV